MAGKGGGEKEMELEEQASRQGDGVTALIPVASPSPHPQSEVPFTNKREEIVAPIAGAARPHHAPQAPATTGRRGGTMGASGRGVATAAVGATSADGTTSTALSIPTWGPLCAR